MPKIFLIGALSSDGFIAKNAEHSPMNWTSKEDKHRFVELTKHARVVIMGANTYRTFPKPLKDRLNVVYSRSLQPTEGVEVTSDEPSVLIDSLVKRGYTEIAICGGAEIYTMFMKSGLVNYLYLTIEPVIFGSGVSLFNKPVDVKLILESSTTTESGTIFNNYKVLND